MVGMVQKDAGTIRQRIVGADPCFIQKEGGDRDKQYLLLKWGTYPECLRY
jgi:hypothetical protein